MQPCLWMWGGCFFSRENKMTSQRIWRSSQKRFISSRPSRSFCTVWDATIQEVISIRGSRWSNGPFFQNFNKYRAATGLWKPWKELNLKRAPWKPWICRFLRPRTLNNRKYPSFSNVTLLEKLNCVALPLQVYD